MPTDRPRAQRLLPEHVERVCKPGQPGCCAYLASRRAPDFFCGKADADLVRFLAQRRADGSIGARGDNCSGPPEYKATP